MDSSRSHPLRRDRDDDDWAQHHHRRSEYVHPVLPHHPADASTSPPAVQDRKDDFEAGATPAQDVNGTTREWTPQRDPRNLATSLPAVAACSSSDSDKKAFFPQLPPPWSPPPALTAHSSPHDESNASMTGNQEAQHHYTASLDAAINDRLEEHRFLILDSVSAQLQHHRDTLLAEIQGSLKGFEARLRQTATEMRDDIFTSGIEALRTKLLSSFEGRIQQVERDLGLGIDTVLARSEGKMTELEGRVDELGQQLNSQRPIHSPQLSQTAAARTEGEAQRSLSRSNSSSGLRSNRPIESSNSNPGGGREPHPTSFLDTNPLMSHQTHSNSSRWPQTVLQPTAEFEPLLKAIFAGQQESRAHEPYGDIVSRHLDSLVAEGRFPDPYPRLNVRNFGGYIKSAFYHRVARLNPSGIPGRAGIAVFEPYWPYMNSLKDTMGRAMEDKPTSKTPNTPDIDSHAKDESPGRHKEPSRQQASSVQGDLSHDESGQHRMPLFRGSPSSGKPACNNTPADDGFPRSSRPYRPGIEQALNQMRSPTQIRKRPHAADLTEGRNAEEEYRRGVQDGSPSKRVRDGDGQTLLERLEHNKVQFEPNGDAARRQTQLASGRRAY